MRTDACMVLIGLVACSPQADSAVRTDVTHDTTTDSPYSVSEQVESAVDTMPAVEPPPVDAVEAPVAGDTLQSALDDLLIPVEGVSVRDLRDTFAEARGGGRLHDAIDIIAPRGSRVVSATGGRVLRLFDSKPGGLMVYATDESERFILLYGHLDGYAEGLHNGMRLQRGQVIGYVGTTGNAPPDTPHLHFAILRGNPSASWSTGTAVNPYPLLTRVRAR